MTRFLSATLAVCATLALAPGAVTPSRADAENAVHYYLSLGDSLAQGDQPTGDFSLGYADQLYSALRATNSKLELIKLGCGGETTASMIDPALPYEGRGAHFFCNYPHGSQLAEAVNFLHAHKSSVSLVTIDIGADDLLHGGGAPTIRANLPVILAALHAAAGPSVPIIGMTYYDPFLAAIWFTTFDLAALQAEANVNTINGALEDVYGAFADPVARVDTAFSNTDTTI